MSTSILKILCLFYVAQNFVSADLALNSRCRTAENLPGICVEIRKCKPVMDTIAAGTVHSNKPTVCSQQEQTVCCPTQSPLSVRSSVDRAAAARNEENEATKVKESEKDELEEMPLRDAPERISERKCREYGQNVFHTIRIAPTLIGGKPREIRVDKCKHKQVALIVGGTEAKPFEFPHQGLVGYGRRNNLKFFCGCTLVSPRFAMTAAHCLEKATNSRILKPKAVKLGSISRDGDNDRTVIVDIVEIFKYDHYIANRTTVMGDIALLKLAEEVTLNEFILPICLPTKQHEDERGIVTGFGKTQNGEIANNLMKVTLERFSHSRCQELWNNKIIDSNANLCYGHHTEMKDSCNGDSGGPLLVSNANKVSCTYTQIGIVSFGLNKCGTIGFPGVYVNVYNYLDWIEGIVWKDEE
ncbi:trypsin-1-like [Chironomus tepperi]|uniref:trypsin-1-like n=1 Tax=Chironomus tepperi TaxID=113505 RepID=UPI00391F5F6F